MGPTASGKSALGVTLAQSMGAVICNSDAMQCYADLPILTARPREAEMGGVPHHLYGIWPAATDGNAALWHAAVVPLIHAEHAQGRIPILLGGTGMYIKTLMEGFAPIPSIDPALRARIRAQWDDDSATAYARFCEADPEMAARLKAGDTQRILRSMEVLEQTGISLAQWQERESPPPFTRARFLLFHIEMDRELLYARINQRFDAMLAAGALDELQALLHAQPDLSSPLMRACGVPELRAYLDGQMGYDDAVTLAKQHSRNYAKRQLTWLRNQCADAIPISFESLQDPDKKREVINMLTPVTPSS